MSTNNQDKNLNELFISLDTKKVRNNSTGPNSIKVEAHFRNIEDFLVEKIKLYSNGAIFGCVAWLTSEKILDALSKCNTVQIVVQKEDFLRPDSNFIKEKEFYRMLKERYVNIRGGWNRLEMLPPICDLSWGMNPNIEAIRCMGTHNSENKPAAPRMHNKFW